MFVNRMVLMLFACEKGSRIVPAVSDNVNACNPCTVSMFLNIFFLRPAITDSRYFGTNQIPVLRVSIKVRVDCIVKACVVV